MVLFESPHRLAATLADLAAAMGGGRHVVVAREMTKLHEEFWRGTLDEAVAFASAPVKGEVVMVVAGSPPAAGADDDRIRVVLAEALSAGASTRDAADEAARRLGVSRRRAYRLALE
jgi:16S rRNA (cytidine1402-2'-O)-methyltransferase